MRIGVDGHVLSGKFQGSRTYLLNLYRAVIEKNHDHEFVFFGHWSEDRPYGDKVEYVEFPSASRWKRLTSDTDRLIRKHGIDLYHSNYIAPIRLSCRSLLTIHDILFESHSPYFSNQFVLRSRFLVRRSANKAVQIHTVSNYSRKEIIDRYNIDESRIRIVQDGVDLNNFSCHNRQASAKAVCDKFGVSDYILTVGRIEPRKNHVTLLRAYARLLAGRTDPGPLVVVGQPDFGYNDFFATLKALGLEHRVKIIDHADDAMLVNLYCAARLFVYPSFAEGFGIPPLEAMACGTPVITSNATALCEIAGEAAVQIDPHSAEQLANAMNLLLNDSRHCESLVSRGLKQAAAYTWSHAAEQYLKAVAELPSENLHPVRQSRNMALDIHKTVAFCGTRGLPAHYGGFETAVDEITLRFVRKGVTCEVFSRAHTSEDKPRVHRGRHLTYVEGSRRRKFDTFVSSFQTGWHLLRNRRKYGYVFWFNNANLPGILLTRLARIPMSVNTDGLEWRRAKWSWPFKVYYYFSSFLVAKFCKSLIADSKGIQAFYRAKFGTECQFIPYGTPAILPDDSARARAILERVGLEPGRYFLQITRLEPDNLPLEAATAFQKTNLDKSGFVMVVVGYQGPTPYASTLKDLHGESGIRVLNATYDPELLHILRRNCYCYVHGNSVGGTNPALLEAMATCPRVMAIDSPFSREVMGSEGTFFDPNDIAAAFIETTRQPAKYDELSKQVSSRYQWEAVAQSYMRLAGGLDANYCPAATTKLILRDRRMSKPTIAARKKDRTLTPV